MGGLPTKHLAAAGGLPFERALNGSSRVLLSLPLLDRRLVPFLFGPVLLDLLQLLGLGPVDPRVVHTLQPFIHFLLEQRGLELLLGFLTDGNSIDSFRVEHNF